MPQLSKYTDISNIHITATTTDILTCEVDTEGCEGVRFVAIGTSALVTITVLHAASTTATFVSVGSSVTYQTSAGKAMCVVDIYHPRKRWVQGVCTAAGNSYMGMFAEKYGLRKTPVAWSATAGLPTTGGGVRCCISPSSTA